MKLLKKNKFPTVNLILRNDKKNEKNGTFLLSYIVNFKGKNLKRTTGYSILQKNWDKKTKSVKPSNAETRKIHAETLKTISSFNEYFTKLEANGINLTEGLINDFFLGKKIENFCSYYENKLNDRINNNEISKPTIEKYKLCIKIFQEFCQKKKIGTPAINEIKQSLIVDFDKYLIYSKKISSDSASNYHKCLKYVFKKAYMEELIDRSPYFNFIPEKAKRAKIRHGLNRLEIKKIEELDIPSDNKTLKDVKRIFLLMCYTGLRFSDIHSINFNQRKIVNSSLNNEKIIYLDITQKKTKSIVRVPLLSKALTILNLFKSKMVNRNEGYVVPKITNQAMNRNLKVLGKMAGLDIILHCHLARHSFATILLNQGLSIDYVSKLLGHSDIGSTRIYAKHDILKVLETAKTLDFLENRVYN